MITFDDIKNDNEVQTLLKLSERQLEVLGYTEHSFRHVGIVCKRIKDILTTIGATEREIQLGMIAGYLHDIGNSVNRQDHAQSGALLAYQLLLRKGMLIEESAEVLMAIGNHDEKAGRAVSRMSAALILADKSDVHRSRVRRNKLDNQFSLTSRDIHDRVNYAVETSDLLIDMEKKIISLEFTIDTQICSTMDYFEIFLERMNMSKIAANYLGMGFKLLINGNSLV